MANFDEICEEDALSGSLGGIDAEGDRFVDYTDHIRVPEPVVIRGAGNMTLFGLSNRFNPTFPSTLAARVSPEEFRVTIDRVNGTLRKLLPLNLKWLICGCLCCCCTAGCSLWPVVCLNRRTTLAIAKLLHWENARLYHRLGLEWRLDKQRCQSGLMREYVLLLESVPKKAIHRPD